MKLLITSSRMPFALDLVRKLGERGHERPSVLRPLVGRSVAGPFDPHAPGRAGGVGFSAGEVPARTATR